MGNYREIEGDLLDLFDQGEFEIIAHGCNCRNTMGAGIAAQIKDRYPEMWYADVYHPLLDFERLGNFSTNDIESIFNLYTQIEPGANADLGAIRMALKKMALELGPQNLFPFKIGLPLIGCGIGGLKWDYVKVAVKEELREFDVTVVHWDKN